MAAEKIEDKPAVYLVEEVPFTLDKPRFNFETVPYSQGMESTKLSVQIRQLSQKIEAAQADTFEDLIDLLATLEKEQTAYTQEHGHENKILRVRIQRMEQRLADWVDPDLDGLMSQFEGLMDRQMKYILAALEYVPQAWLIKGAPLAAGIDWKNIENLKYLRSDKFQALAKAKQQAENDSPN